MSNTTVHVKNISHKTTEKQVRDFFSFCGKIRSISVTPTSNSPDALKSATVTFEKETAAKTALLLDNTTLDESQVHVESAASIDQLAGTGADEGHRDEHDIAQEDKPRSRIAAEYLAHGYKLSDVAIQKAIAFDQQHGVSTRFTNVLKQFDTKYGATDKAKSVDAKYGVSQKGQGAWNTLNVYFEKAMGTPTGQKIRQFYEVGNKQVMDVHEEAKRLAGMGAGSHNKLEQIPGTNRTKCSCGGEEGVCACEPGKCACSSCAKNPEENPPEKVDEEGHTKCGCGGAEGVCTCAPGNCRCASCAKNH